MLVKKRILPYLTTGAIFAFLMVLYVWPMWWNHWPIVFNDISGYLETARLGTAFVSQSPGYGLFIYILFRFWYHPEMIVLAQTALVIIALWHLGDSLGTPVRRRLLCLIALGILTPLPLICSMLLPDALFFAGVVALTSLLLRRQPHTKIGPMILVAIAMTVHLATGVLFLIILVTSRLLLRYSPYGPSPVHHATRRLAIYLLMILLGTQFTLNALYPVPNVPIWATNLTGQLIDNNGLAIDELKKTCGQVNYSLCPYIKQIEGTDSDFFLWNPTQPLHAVWGNWAGTPQDWPALVWATVKHHPKESVRWILHRWWRQIFTFQIGYEYGYTHWDPNLTKALTNNFGAAATQRQLDSRQEHRWFNPMPEPWPAVYDLTALLSFLSPIFLWLYWRRDGRRHISLVLVVALLINALLMGTVSRTQNRYQLRILYLPLTVLLFAISTPRITRPKTQEH